MDVADKMDQESEVAVSSETIVVSVFEALRVLVDFPRNAISTGASRGNIGAPVMQTNIDEVPGPRRFIFSTELEIRSVRSYLHGRCNCSFLRRYAQDARHVARGHRSEIVRRDHRDDLVPIRSPTPRRYGGEQECEHQPKNRLLFGRIQNATNYTEMPRDHY